MQDTPPAKKRTKLTPMLRQYYELKSQLPFTAVLFFRMGDFYELFDDDAAEIAPILGIVLTSRDKGGQGKIPFCGVPHHSSEHHIAKLLGLGYRVAMAQQIAPDSSSADTSPSSSPAPATARTSLMQRQVVRIHTPACSDLNTPLEHHLPLYLAAAYECASSGRWVLCLSDYATGLLRIGDLDHFDEVLAYLKVFEPREILIRKFQIPKLQASYPEASPSAHQGKHHALISELSDTALKAPPSSSSSSSPTSASTASSSWEKVYERLLQTSGNTLHPSAKTLLWAVLHHYRQLYAPCTHFRTLQGLDDPACMHLTEVVIRDLELVRGLRSGNHTGSLWGLIHHTLSPMGSRRLRHRLLHPYVCRTKITTSHHILSFLLQSNRQLLHQLRNLLRGMHDLEKLSSKLLSGSCPVSHLTSIRSGLEASTKIAALLRSELSAQSPATTDSSSSSPSSEESSTASSESFFASCQSLLRKAQAPFTLLQKGLYPEPGRLNSEDKVIADGYLQELDEAREFVHNAATTIANYESSLQAKLQIPTLKVRDHKVFGLLIEVTKIHMSKMGPEFTPKQTMAQAQRYTHTELDELAQNIYNAKDRVHALEHRAYEGLCRQLLGYKEDLLEIAECLGQIDLYAGLAHLAQEHNFVCPAINDGSRIALEHSFHPIVKSQNTSASFVTNSLVMYHTHKQILITGPNMGGKSTMMRQLALTALLAQMGSFVPAHNASLPLFDGIFIRVGASDDLSAGKSTFMVEMSESADILTTASASSLVLFDELGRGTSTKEGMVLAYAVLEDLATRIQSWALFATHYHEITQKAAQSLPHVRHMRMEVVQKQQDEPQFTYKLIDGICHHSFGIQTAQWAGIPHHVLQKARELLTSSEYLSSAPTSPTAPPYDLSETASAAPPSASATPLPSSSGSSPLSSAVLSEIRSLSTQDLSPLKAIHLILNWKERLQSSSASTHSSHPSAHHDSGPA